MVAARSLTMSERTPAMDQHIRAHETGQPRARETDHPQAHVTGHLDRRAFLEVSAYAAGGLLVGVSLPACSATATEESGRAAGGSPDSGVFAPNAWLRITRDGVVTVIVPRSEMGQGVTTGLPMLVAEELDVEMSRIRVESAPAARVYDNPAFRAQATGGSTSIKTAWEPLRRAGATTRAMLVTAAARTWQVPESECATERGVVVHRPTGRRLDYGTLAPLAATLPVPTGVRLKDPSEYRIIGTRVRRLDSGPKVDGTAVFGLDVRPAGHLVATVARCPVFGGRVKRVRPEAALAVPGVRHVVTIESGVGVVADSFWAARQGRDALEVEWDEGPRASVSSQAFRDACLAAVTTGGGGDIALARGDADIALRAAPRALQAVYEFPFLAHATMEPMNCTAHVRADGCEIWAPTQNQAGARLVGADLTGLPLEKVRVHTTLLGGGFGRRAEIDFVVEAVLLSKAVSAPVKVVWTREDDMQHDTYRPATVSLIRAGLDQQGMPIAWAHRIAGPSIRDRIIKPFARMVMPDWFPRGLRDAAGGTLARLAGLTVDRSATEGADTLPYTIDHVRVEYLQREAGVPVGFWRSVGHSQNAFVVETFLDEVAIAGGHDPYELRRRLLDKSPRHLRVLEAATRAAGWGTPPPSGVHRGLAVHESFGSWVAEVAEVSVAEDGSVRVHRVVCAIDCGTAVNPDLIEAQMESGIVFGLSAALKGEITVERGRVVQSNFHDYPVLRFHEMPVVEVHILPSAEPPGGVGEPSTPPIAPALANAIFAATGKRVRRLPIRAEDLART
jgi:isoquinoline 1-oxidoreductase subunit beta